LEITYKLSELNKACDFILNNVKNKIILISGDVGAGKTTLIKEYCKLIGVNEVVNSPTYTLINEYLSKNGNVVHMDLYRVKNINEINELGLFDYFENNLVIIEWPEIILKILDLNHSILKITYLNENERKLSIKNI
jgi:tRNA threonylcarbamoyladenosine biosynthesis protein TsaE